MRQFAGLLLLLMALLGCSKPSLVGTWQSGSNPPAQFVVTVRSDGTYSMLATSVGPGRSVMRFDGNYQTTGDSIQLNIHDANLIGGDASGDVANARLLADYLPGGAPSQLHLVDGNSSQLTMAGHVLAMARVTGQDISAGLNPDEKAAADNSNKPQIVQGGKWTVHKMDEAPSDSNPSQPAATAPVATDATTATQQPTTSNTSAIDNGMGQTAPPAYPGTSTTGGQDPTQTTGRQTTGDQATGSNPPDPTNPPAGTTGSATADGSAGTSTSG